MNWLLPIGIFAGVYLLTKKSEEIQKQDVQPFPSVEEEDDTKEEPDPEPEPVDPAEAKEHAKYEFNDEFSGAHRRGHLKNHQDISFAVNQAQCYPDQMSVKGSFGLMDENLAGTEKQVLVTDIKVVLFLDYRVVYDDPQECVQELIRLFTERYIEENGGRITDYADYTSELNRTFAGYDELPRIVGTVRLDSAKLDASNLLQIFDYDFNIGALPAGLNLLDTFKLVKMMRIECNFRIDKSSYTTEQVSVKVV